MSEVTDELVVMLRELGWTTHREVRDVTEEEEEALSDRGTFQRNGEAVMLVGQTDCHGDTYCTQAENEDGDIILAPDGWDGLVGPETDVFEGHSAREKQLEGAIRELCERVLDEVPDNYAQCIAFRL